MTIQNSYRAQPSADGHFGQFGGRYVAETLMPLVLDLDREYRAAKTDPAFRGRARSSHDALCRAPQPALLCERMTAAIRADADEGWAPRSI
jgi:tryptophan synthase beta chain